VFPQRWLSSMVMALFCNSMMTARLRVGGSMATARIPAMTWLRVGGSTVMAQIMPTLGSTEPSLGMQ
jgi:hypothetical protein